MSEEIDYDDLSYEEVIEKLEELKSSDKRYQDLLDSIREKDWITRLLEERPENII
jgi:hypothetical protein